MKRSLTWGPIAVGLGMVCVVSQAQAQEAAFEALGQAPVVAGDRVRARERALDEALRQALEQAAATVVPPDELVARASQLKLKIYPRARAFVPTYRVLDEGEQNGLFQVHLSAQVATGALRRELVEGGPVGTTALPRLASKLRGVVCLEPSLFERPGTPAEAAPAEKVVRELLTARSVELGARPHACDEAQAAEAARAEGAQGAVVGKLTVTDGGPIRGTPLAGAHARVQLKVLDPTGRAGGEADGERDAFGADRDRAGQLAAQAAAEEATRALTPQLAQRWAQATPGGSLRVRVTGIARFADYQAVTRALAALPGVQGVEPRRFLRGEAELLVRTASAAGQLQAALERLPPQGVRATVRPAPSGDGLDITLTSEPVPERG